MSRILWFRQDESVFPDQLVHETAVFANEDNTVTLTVATLESIMKEAGYSLVRKTD
jgi:hypothetical protein